MVNYSNLIYRAVVRNECVNICKMPRTAPGTQKCQRKHLPSSCVPAGDRDCGLMIFFPTPHTVPGADFITSKVCDE